METVTYLTVTQLHEHFPHEELSSKKAEFAILEAQEIINNWLLYNPLPTEYKDKIVTNNQGILLLRNYPVIQIHSITAQPLLGQEINYSEREIVLMWRESDRALYTTVASCPVEIKYLAGYSPLPQIFYVVFLNLLKACFKNNDFNFQELYSPVKDVSSISLGGLSQSFRLGGTGNNSSTQLDRILQPLARYRRKILT